MAPGRCQVSTFTLMVSICPPGLRWAHLETAERKDSGWGEGG